MIGYFLINSQALNDWMILSQIIAFSTWHFLIPMLLGSGLGLALGFGVGLVLWLGFDLFGVILPDFSTKQSSYNRSVPDLYQSPIIHRLFPIFR